MAKSKDYLPKGDTKFLLWLDSFNNKLPTYAATLNVPQEVMDEFKNSYTSLDAAIRNVDKLKKDL